MSAITSPAAFSLYAETAPQVLAAGGLVTAPHNLGVVPKIWIPYLICVTAEGNYAVNDYFPANPESLNANCGYTSYQPDATNCYARIGSGGRIFFQNKTTGADFTWTIANWKMFFRVAY